MSQPEKGNLVFKIVSLVGGVALAIEAVVEIHNGKVVAGRSHPDVFYAAHQPVLFWIFVGLKIVASAVFFYCAFKRKKDNA